MTRSLVTEKRRAEVGRDPLVCVGKELAQAPAPAEMLDTSLRDVARSLALVGPGDAPGGDALAHSRKVNTSTERRAVLQHSSVTSLFFLVYKGIGFTLLTRLYARQREQGQT